MLTLRMHCSRYPYASRSTLPPLQQRGDEMTVQKMEQELSDLREAGRKIAALTAELAAMKAERDAALRDAEQRRRLIVGIRHLIADDSHALTFQTMGSYRGNLLKTIDAAREG